MSGKSPSSRNLRRYCKPEKRLFAKQLRKNPTSTERRLWESIRCKRLGSKFRRQVIVRGYIVDFYSASARLIVEVDGAGHDTPDQAQWDQRRTEVLQGLGFTVLRFKNQRVWDDLESVLNEIKGAIK